MSVNKMTDPASVVTFVSDFAVSSNNRQKLAICIQPATNTGSLLIECTAYGTALGQKLRTSKRCLCYCATFCEHCVLTNLRCALRWLLSAEQALASEPCSMTEEDTDGVSLQLESKQALLPRADRIREAVCGWNGMLAWAICMTFLVFVFGITLVKLPFIAPQASTAIVCSREQSK